jgi:hypothetical protein
VVDPQHILKKLGSAPAEEAGWLDSQGVCGTMNVTPWVMVTGGV